MFLLRYHAHSTAAYNSEDWRNRGLAARRYAHAVCLADRAAANIAGTLCIRQGMNHKQQGDNAALDRGTSHLASDPNERTTAGRQCSSHGRRMRATTATAAAATGAARRTRREPTCAMAAPAAAPLLEAAATEPRPGLRLVRADRLPPPAAPPVRLLPCVSSPPNGLAASWLQAAAARGVSDACATPVETNVNMTKM